MEYEHNQCSVVTVMYHRNVHYGSPTKRASNSVLPRTSALSPCAAGSAVARSLGLLDRSPRALAGLFLLLGEAVPLPVLVPALAGVRAFAATMSVASCLAAAALVGVWALLPRIPVSSHWAATAAVSRAAPLLWAALSVFRSCRAVFTASVVSAFCFWALVFCSLLCWATSSPTRLRCSALSSTLRTAMFWSSRTWPLHKSVTSWQGLQTQSHNTWMWQSPDPCQKVTNYVGR